MIDTQELRLLASQGEHKRSISNENVLELLDLLDMAESRVEEIHNLSDENSMLHAEIRGMNAERSILLDLLKEARAAVRLEDEWRQLGTFTSLNVLREKLKLCKDIKIED